MAIMVQKSRAVEQGGAVLDRSRYHIDPAATGHIAAILRNMYSDPIAAVVREYYCNAYDAHIKDSVGQPIEVHLPTKEEPFFSVRDFGKGLSVEDTKQLLHGFGSSGQEKRESNAYVGGFGIGCKCAFAVSTAFTYTIWHDGRVRVWSCFLDEYDQGQATLLSDTPSTVSSGILVTVPVAVGTEQTYYQRFQALLAHRNEPVTVTGGTFIRPPPRKYIYRESLKLTTVAATQVAMRVDPATCDPTSPSTLGSVYDCEVCLDTEGHDKPRLLMGGIAYDIDLAQLTVTRTECLKHTIFRVPIGTVQLAPNRESLQYSAHVKARLNGLCEHVRSKAFQDRVTRHLGRDVKTVADACQAAETIRYFRLTESKSLATLAPQLGLDWLYAPDPSESIMSRRCAWAAEDGTGYIPKTWLGRRAGVDSVLPHPTCLCCAATHYSRRRSSWDDPFRGRGGPYGMRLEELDTVSPTAFGAPVSLLLTNGHSLYRHSRTCGVVVTGVPKDAAVSAVAQKDLVLRAVSAALRTDRFMSISDEGNRGNEIRSTTFLVVLIHGDLKSAETKLHQVSDAFPPWIRDGSLLTLEADKLPAADPDVVNVPKNPHAGTTVSHRDTSNRITYEQHTRTLFKLRETSSDADVASQYWEPVKVTAKPPAKPRVMVPLDRFLPVQRAEATGLAGLRDITEWYPSSPHGLRRWQIALAGLKKTGLLPHVPALGEIYGIKAPSARGRMAPGTNCVTPITYIHQTVKALIASPTFDKEKYLALLCLRMTLPGDVRGDPYRLPTLTELNALTYAISLLPGYRLLLLLQALSSRQLLKGTWLHQECNWWLNAAMSPSVERDLVHVSSYLGAILLKSHERPYEAHLMLTTDLATGAAVHPFCLDIVGGTDLPDVGLFKPRVNIDKLPSPDATRWQRLLCVLAGIPEISLGYQLGQIHAQVPGFTDLEWVQHNVHHALGGSYPNDHALTIVHELIGKGALDAYLRQQVDTVEKRLGLQAAT